MKGNIYAAHASKLLKFSIISKSIWKLTTYTRKNNILVRFVTRALHQNLILVITQKWSMKAKEIIRVGLAIGNFQLFNL